MDKQKTKVGIKCLYFGNLAKIICSLLTIIGTVLALKYLNNVGEELTWYQTAIGIVTLVSAFGFFLSIVAIIFGVYTIKNSHKKLRTSYYLYMCTLLVNIIASFMEQFEGVFKAISLVVEIIAGLMLILGVISITTDTEKMGRSTIFIYGISFIISAISLVLGTYLSGTVSTIFNIVYPILEIVGYVFLVGFFKKANESLKKC